MQTALLPVPLAPEISLHLAGDRVGLFDSADGQFRSDVPPPFWAFVWAGGQALARYVLDHPDLVRGRHVLDVASGSGVAAIAAARAGAARVEALDLDPAAATATTRNAEANGVTVHARAADIGDAGPAEVILAGDVFYTRSVADRMTAALRRAAAAGAVILVGDPGRGYFPERLFIRRAEYTVPVPASLEETEALATGVWEMRATITLR
ncbi:50S ribosomal protein L11 methyltransferase [Couchioplanes caeruleus]|uniref:class I SAM-dependent methyltransferase n=1 Tax=Couchioplanes caeruleus TaxID=56438 RepID=UPI0020BF6452|nr:50S ribosomal protein L11 methyltransferase [Couchioplanes caeruleus]UQU63668.1 50S ribosomal protein L11 methyltransferase [Couchioplanes caeruleus]